MANLLTFGRMALVIPFVACFLIDVSWGVKAGFAVFVVAALTDFLDGRVARARNEVSALGAALDPLADKLLIAAALVLLVRNGVVHGLGVIAVLVIILRELLVTGLREAVIAKGETLPVTRLAKWKTTAQLLAAGLFIAAAPAGFLSEAWRPVASGFLWLAAILTFWTGADYAARAAQLLRGR